MDPPPTLELERFAALSAELEAGSSSDEILAREGLSEEAWARVQELWQGQMAEEVSRGRFELTQRYNAAFNARRDGLALRVVGPQAPPSADALPESLTGEIVVAPREDASPESLTGEIVAPPKAEASPESRTGEIVAPPKAEASPESRTGEIVVAPRAEALTTLPDVAPRAEALTTLPDIEPRAEAATPPPDTQPIAVSERALDRVTPIDVMEAAPSSESPLTPRVPTMQTGRLISATPFIAVHEPRRDDLDDAPTPAPSTEDPVETRAKVSTLPPGAEPGDAEPSTPAPPRSMGRDGRDDGPRLDGLPFRPPPSVAPDTPPRASSSALPDILPFRATGAASVFGPPPSVGPAPAPSAAHSPLPAPAPAPAPAAPPIPAAAPTLPGASSPPPGAFPFASSAQPRHEPAARPPAGAFPFAPGATPRAAMLPASPPVAQLMMPASLGASTCRLTIEQFASLSAEIAITPGASAQVRARYGLDEMTHMAESGVWHRRFSVDKELFTRYSALYQSYREWLTKTLR